MPLFDRKTPRDTGNIRSLSAPTIQVRKNRTSQLRHIFSVHNDDLSYLTRPPMGETNPSVAGQNKSTAKMNDKQIGLWFRDRCYMVDKLERYEDEVYQRLVAIEKTKWSIQKSRENSPDRLEPPSRNKTTTNLPRIDAFVINRGLVATPVPDKQGEDGNKNEDESKNGNTEKDKEGETKLEKGSKDDKKDDKMDTKENKPATVTISDEPADNSIPMNVSAKQIPVRPATQQQNAITPRPAMEPRAATNGEGMLDSARKISNVADPVEKTEFPRPKTDGAFVKRNDGSRNNLNRLAKSDSVNRVYAHPTSPRKSTESLTKAKEIEQKILNEPFVFWKKNTTGRLVKAEVPYKRRDFPLPIERNDEERRKKLLDTERRSKRDHIKRYKNLCDDLVTLEKFNPLAEMLELRRLEAEKAKEEFDAQEKWKKLGMLRHWVRAIQVREQKELAGLDPNSEEALRRCKYLRLQDKKGVTPLTPKEEKEAMKKSIANNLQKRIAKAVAVPQPNSSTMLKT